VELVPEMIYRVRTTEPLSPTDGSPFGPRQYWQVSEASLDGDRIHARLASTGIDWMSMGPDGLYRPDVRPAFVTDDDAAVLMHYTGLVEPLPAFQAAAAEDRETGWDDPAYPAGCDLRFRESAISLADLLAVRGRGPAAGLRAAGVPGLPGRLSRCTLCGRCRLCCDVVASAGRGGHRLSRRCAETCACVMGSGVFVAACSGDISRRCRDPV